jgi:phage terminase small subunit
MAGRPRKPTAVLKAQGTFRAHRHDSRPATINDGGPQKPAWLTGEGEACWWLIVASLPPGVLAKVDGLVLAGACQWWQLWREFGRQLAAGEGDAYKLIVQLSVAWKNFSQAAAKMGLSPVDRERLKIVEPEPADKKDRFFNVVA